MLKQLIMTAAKSDLGTGCIAIPGGRPTHSCPHNHLTIFTRWHQYTCPCNTLFLWPTWPTTSDIILIGSAVFPQYILITNGLTDGQNGTRLVPTIYATSAIRPKILDAHTTGIYIYARLNLP